MGKTYPEIPDYIKKMMREGEELDEIRIDAEGHWFHNGTEFKNKKGLPGTGPLHLQYPQYFIPLPLLWLFPLQSSGQVFSSR